MPAFELVVADLVARLAQLRDDAPAGAVDGQHRVVGPVRDIELRPAVGCGRCGEAGRVGENALEQVAVDQAQRQRVGGAVGEAADRHPGWIDRPAGEDLGQHAIDRLHVRTVGAQDHVPGSAVRIRCCQQPSVLLRDRAQERHQLLGSAAGTVEHDHERGRGGGLIPRRHMDQAVAHAGQPEDMLSGLLGCRVGECSPKRPRQQPPVLGRVTPAPALGRHQRDRPGQGQRSQQAHDVSPPRPDRANRPRAPLFRSALPSGLRLG